jgi:hypothetical protein
VLIVSKALRYIEYKLVIIREVSAGVGPELFPEVSRNVASRDTNWTICRLLALSLLSLVCHEAIRETLRKPQPNGGSHFIGVSGWKDI